MHGCGLHALGMLHAASVFVSVLPDGEAEGGMSPQCGAVPSVLCGACGWVHVSCMPGPLLCMWAAERHALWFELLLVALAAAAARRASVGEKVVAFVDDRCGCMHVCWR